MLKIQVYTCKNHLENTLDKDSVVECMGFIKEKKESIHFKTLECQKSKFQRLCHKSRKIEGGCSKTPHGDHDEIETNNTSDSKSTQTTIICRSETFQVPPITEAQLKVLSHGPNFAMVPRCPPVGEYISSIEQVCSQLKQGEAERLRGEIKSILKKIQLPKSNITRVEQKALVELRRDKNRIILTADKGVSMIVMDKEDYIRKAQELLDQLAYKPISTDPSPSTKTRCYLC